jgi:SAM-dependent methyltransferase
VSEFSAEWLALREPADWRSRSARVLRAVADVLPKGRPIRAVDLAAGTGSNARFLATVLPSPQEWLLVDRSEELLDRARAQLGAPVQTRAIDLSKVAALDALFASSDLITASALLDLVSEVWLHAMCAACGRHRAAVLFTLSYDGRIECSPAEPADELIRSLVNRHQRTDKGFGLALGPDAAAHAVQHLQRLGYHVIHERSDWVLDPESADLQRELIEGWAAAARAVSPADGEAIRAWLARRIFHVGRGNSRLLVGHEDVGAFMA